MNIFILIPSAIILYKLLRFDLNHFQSKLTILLMAIFPTVYSYGSAQSDSIFLFFSVCCFYFARRKQFILASVFALLTTLTKLSGIFIWPFLLLEFYSSNSSDIKKTLKHPSFPLNVFTLYGLFSYIDSQFRKVRDYSYYENCPVKLSCSTKYFSGI
jgi:Gpi18-like mannosyltransferase